MNSISGNRGIVQSGGEINANQLTVGDHAQSIQIASDIRQRLEAQGRKEIADRLDVVIACVQKEASSPTRDDLLHATMELGEEMASDQPERGRVERLLAQLADGARAAGRLAAASGGLISAVNALATAVSMII